MKTTLEKAWGYQGDNMHLPVRDLVAALPFYQKVLGFTIKSRSDTPHNSVVLARDQVEIGLAENGGDSTQDGCAFHVQGIESLIVSHSRLSHSHRCHVAWFHTHHTQNDAADPSSARIFTRSLTADREAR